MTVKELIKELEKFDPDLEVFNKLWSDECLNCDFHCGPNAEGEIDGIPCEFAWDVPDLKVGEWEIYKVDSDGKTLLDEEVEVVEFLTIF
jgi:hypothetical protein